MNNVYKKFRVHLDREFRACVYRLMNRSLFEEDFLRYLPKEFHETAKLVFDFRRFVLEEEKKIAKNIEEFRSRAPLIADTERISSYSSPHSSTFKKNEHGHAVPGDLTNSSIEAHMKTGVNKRGGLLLRRIVQGVNAKRILELGTNTGFSGCYFLSFKTVESLVTIEGSSQLCKIAIKNLHRISSNFKVLNMLFDEAIDKLIEESEKFDCAFIDGQHEREAVLHYFNRLLPLIKKGGIIIFDDIYWSDDMNQAWKELCRNPLFSQTYDFGSKGVCVLRLNDTEPSRHYDICEYIGRPSIFRKGW